MLLSDKEIREATKEPPESPSDLFLDASHKIAKAQLKKMVEWLARCRSESTREFACFSMSREQWQALLKEVE